jgi:hypothetical protein
VERKLGPSANCHPNDNIASQQFMFVDATWERVMGYAAHDVMGKATHDFFSCTSCALIEAISLNIKEV